MAHRQFRDRQSRGRDDAQSGSFVTRLRTPLHGATGLSPIKFVQRLRIEEAQRRLEQTSAPIDEISWEVGYEDAAAFRRLFKRIARVTPGAYRRKFGVSNLV